MSAQQVYEWSDREGDRIELWWSTDGPRVPSLRLVHPDRAFGDEDMDQALDVLLPTDPEEVERLVLSILTATGCVITPTNGQRTALGVRPRPLDWNTRGGR